MQIHAADLELFFAIHRGGTITDAARLLGLQQSTVSRRLSALEDRLGAALFVRARDGVHLTALGSQWLAPAQSMWTTVRAAERVILAQLDPQADLEVTITSLHSFTDHVLVPALPTLYERAPRLRLRFIVTGAVMDMTRLEADIAIRTFRPQAGDLVAQRVAWSAVVPCASPTLAARLQDQPPASWPWINVGLAQQLPPPIAQWMKTHGVAPRLTVTSGTTQIEALRAHVGVGWMPEPLRKHLGFVAMPTDDLPMFEGGLWMTAHRAQRQLPHVDVVWRWIDEVFRTAPR